MLEKFVGILRRRMQQEATAFEDAARVLAAFERAVTESLSEMFWGA